MPPPLSWRELALCYLLVGLGLAVPAFLRNRTVSHPLPALKPEENWLMLALPRQEAGVPQEVREAALAEGLDPFLVAALVEVESGNRPQAVSSRGAVGLMQVLPSTAQLMGVEDHGRAQENLRAGCRYLRWLMEDFGDDWELVLAAYNAGPGAVYRYGGVPPFAETRAFIAKVKEAYQRLAGVPWEAARAPF